MKKKAFHDMMKSMFVLEPSKRATIENMVRCEWMQRWGLSEMQRMQDIVRDSGSLES